MCSPDNPYAMGAHWCHGPAIYQHNGAAIVYSDDAPVCILSGTMYDRNGQQVSVVIHSHRMESAPGADVGEGYTVFWWIGECGK